MAVVYFILYLTFITSHDNLNSSNDNERRDKRMALNSEQIEAFVGGLVDEIRFEALIDAITDKKEGDVRNVDVVQLRNLFLQYVELNVGRKGTEGLHDAHLDKEIMGGLSRYLRFSDNIPWTMMTKLVMEREIGEDTYILRYDGILTRIQPDNRPKGLSQLKRQMK